MKSTNEELLSSNTPPTRAVLPPIDGVSAPAPSLMWRPEVNMSNTPLKKGFSQVCVWPRRTVNSELPGEVRNFEAGMKRAFNVRVQFLECIVTNPDLDDGVPAPGTGGRYDTFFAIHNEDVMKFAEPRFRHGIRWIEDVLLNGGGYLYPTRVEDYWSWPDQEEEDESNLVIVQADTNDATPGA